MKPLDLFISHSSAEVEVARELKVILDEAGYTSFIAPDDVIGTDTWTEQILDAIEGSRAMIVLVSARANRSSHVSREVNLALGRNRPVLPIRTEPVGPEGSLEYLLTLVQRIDAFPPPIRAHSKTILSRIEAILRTADDPAVEPPKPPKPPKPPTVPSPTPPPTPSGAPNQGLAVGARIAGFTVAGKIGEGGQATIYRASQAEPKRDVALKVIRADQQADATFRTRFLEEQATLAGLEHPSIIPVYAAGAEGGVLFIAMRLIDGPDLGARLRASGPISPIETVRILRPIADALDFAHEHGVIHRDVKPSNILIDSGGRPYLSDFGLGKRTSGAPEISEPGFAVGTLEYMAPEQFSSGEAGAITTAADIYALGGVAYACMSGQPPFRRDTPEQMMHAHLSEPIPSLAASRPELPAAIDDVLGRALAKSPGERYPTATALVDALEIAAASERTRPIPRPTETAPVARMQAWIRANTPVAAIGGVLAIVILVLVGSSVLGGGGGSSPTARPTQVGDVPTATPRPPAPATPTPGPATPTPAPATPAPTRTPLADTYPNAAELRLIAALPLGPGIQDGCRRFEDRYAGTTAGISCNDPSGQTARLYYQSWPDKSAMDAMYRSVLDTAKVVRGGLCKDGPPADGEWVLATGGVVQGQLACFVEARSPGSVSYLWTHDPTLVMSYWSAPSNNAGFEFWKKWVTAPR